MTTKIDLSKSIEAHGETLFSITLREPKVGDLLVMDGITGDNARNIALIAKLADIPPSSVHALSIPDYQKLVAVLDDFFTAGPMGYSPS